MKNFPKLFLAGWLGALTALAQNPTIAFRPELISHLRGNFAESIERPLRYWPINGDFVITNGPEFFNRPLYCLNSAFRIDAGDKPEFSLYLPGRGGNLRLGIKTAGGVKWLNNADSIISHYRPGSMIYEIKDSLLDNRELELTVLPLNDAKGLIVATKLNSPGTPVELFWAFGGANSMKGQRNGDIGCEREPVRKFFQLLPEQCRGNEFTLATNTFLLRGKTAAIESVASLGARHFIADARRWTNAAQLLASANPNHHFQSNNLPVVVGRIALTAGQPVYVALQLADDRSEALPVAALPALLSRAETHRRAIADRVIVDTPDPYINAAAAALNIAADAVWDVNQQSFMHGAVAWRTRLLGWRGAYAGDALGWHERTAAHFAGFAKQQNTNPIPEKLPPADEQFNLARSEAAIHSNGDLSNNHYDMNLVGVDAFFRHLLWTGDTNYAQAMWQVIEWHLAWERRLFRREFGPEKLPLYEAYAAIWASDDLNYNGGGTTHASAYNYWHNQMAARVAKLLGKDATPYKREAALISQAMNQYLWLANEGNFAEYKDYLGLQLTHPNAGLWTFYHTVDSEVPTPIQAWQMAHWIDENISKIPIRGLGVPDEHLFTLPETSWMPYLWSLNNVVMAEAAHTALGFWQANRPDMAFRLFKGELLDSMYLGLCPGNLGCLTGFDVVRGEAQRDFADACGINARALVEGLFGVRPDALAGELKIIPGFPARWNHAHIQHPDFNFSYRRDGLKETYVIEPKFAYPLSLNLQTIALRETVASITVNGQSAKSTWINEPGLPRLGVNSSWAPKTEIVIVWSGGLPKSNIPPVPTEISSPTWTEPLDWEKPLPPELQLEAVDIDSSFNDSVTQIFRNEYRTPRSPFASLALPKQGLNGWCEPKASFDVDDSGLRAAAVQRSGEIILPNGVSFRTPGTAGSRNIIFTSQWDNYPREVSVPLTGKSSHAYLLMAGSTGPMQSRLDNGEIVVTYADESTQRLALNNPVNWWPIDQDYFIDDFAFQRNEPLPPRVDLKTGRVRLLDMKTFKGTGGKIPGGAGTVLDLPLDPSKELKSLTVRALAKEVVIGLMGVTLAR